MPKFNYSIANPALWYWRTQDGNEVDFISGHSPWVPHAYTPPPDQ